MSRRGHGEGSIRKRDDGRWETRLYVTGRDGTRRRVSIYGKTRAEVQHGLREAQRENERDALPVGPSPTVGAFLVQWLEAARTTVRPKTYVSYEGTVRLHLEPLLGRVQLRNLTPAHIQKVLTVKAEDGLSPRSVRYILLVLRIALGQAERWGLVSRNVATLVDGPRIPYRAVTVLTPALARTLLEAARGHRLEALYVLTLSLGLRRGEVVGLHWSDVDLDARRLVVRAALQRIKGEGLQMVETKTARGRRVVTMPDVAWRRSGRTRCDRFRTGSSPARAGSRPASCSRAASARRSTSRQPAAGSGSCSTTPGCPSSGSTISATAASLLLAKGVAPRVVMDVLGHSQIAVTLNTYRHVIPALVDEAAAAMDRALTEDEDKRGAEGEDAGPNEAPQGS